MKSLSKVTDPAKIVTDSLVLEELAKQGIDKDYVEFFRDYSKERPSTKSYRDLKTGKQITVFQGIPKVNNKGEKVRPEWIKKGALYRSGVNLLDATSLPSGETTVAVGEKTVVWNPQVFVAGVEQYHGGSVTRLKADPIGGNYSNNVLEWDFGACVRRLRLIEGMIQELYVFQADPGGDVVIKSNTAGDLSAAGYYAVDANMESIAGFNVVGDEKHVPAEGWKGITYPAIVDDSYTAYSHVNDGYLGGNYSFDNYLDLRAKTSWDTVITNVIKVGQLLSTYYAIFRGYVHFDTSSVPAANLVTAATLYLKKLDSNLATAFTLVIQNGQPTYPRSPVVTEDWNQALYSGNGGQAASSAFGADYVAISMTPSWVTKEGWTKLTLKSSRDIEANSPSDNEWLVFYAQEGGTSNQPKLIVTHSTAPTAPTALLCEGATNPQAVTDLTPEFSAILNDPNAGDTLTHTEIYVGTSSGGSDLWSSGWIDIADVVEGNRCSDISYAGFALSLDGQKKFWKIRAKDSYGLEGAWSDVSFFRPPFIPEEILALPDSVSKSLQRRPFSESLSVTSANLRSLAKLFPEILAMADDRDFVISFVRSYADTLALGDAVTKALIRAFADDLDLVASVSHAITKIMTGEVLGLDDSISLATIKTLLETMSLADQVSILLALTRSLGETVAVSGQVNTQAALIRALAEALPVADAVAKALSVAKADGFDLSDLRLLALGRELAEQLGFTESYIINTIRDIIILDSLSVSDEMSKTKMVDRILAELLGLSDRLRLGGMWDDPNIKIIASILKAAVKAEIIKAEVGTTIPKSGIQTEVR